MQSLSTTEAGPLRDDHTLSSPSVTPVSVDQSNTYDRDQGLFVATTWLQVSQPKLPQLHLRLDFTLTCFPRLKNCPTVISSSRLAHDTKQTVELVKNGTNEPS